MRRTEVLQEIRKMRFEEAYEGWNAGRLTQAEAAAILGMCERSFRRYQARFEADGLEGLIDRRLEQMSNRRAPVDEVVALTDRYRTRHRGWNVRHFHDWYRRDGGKRSYSWVKKHLQAAGLVEKSKQKGTHRKKRERMPLPGMMIHQDGSRHEWVTGQMWDLIVTMDDATNEHYDMRFVEEEGTASSFLGLREVVRTQGLPCTFYSDRGSHYWTTPESPPGHVRARPALCAVAAPAPPAAAAARRRGHCRHRCRRVDVWLANDPAAPLARGIAGHGRRHRAGRRPGFLPHRRVPARGFIRLKRPKVGVGETAGSGAGFLKYPSWMLLY